MTKKRILLAGEATYLFTGFSKYGSEVMKRLYETGKYELAEHSTFATIEDKRNSQVPWKLYPNAVSPSDSRYNQYHSLSANVFGAWRFERVCLDFKPDIVWDFRDPHMLSHHCISPFRRFYHRVIMPAIDCTPQKPGWLYDFINADALFGYTDWGLNAVKEESGGAINTICAASPGIDQYTFFPAKDKKVHRRLHGFDPNAFIVGTIMRNQPRKLFPDLIDAFKIYLDHCKTNDPELYKRSYLYLHTSYPDRDAWEIPDLIKQSGIGNKILFTYVCKNCKQIFVSFFKDAITKCVHCGADAAMLPCVQQGVSEPQLRDVLNLFDVYVQYATNEGFGMPQVEAAACGLPVMAVDHSAMTDVVEKIHGIKIDVQRHFYDKNSGALRALPDNNDFASKLYGLATSSEDNRIKRSKKIRKAVEEHYTWDKTAKIWEDYFDSVELKGLQGKWDSPGYIPHQPVTNVPDGLSNSQFIEWAYANILGEPEKAYEWAGRVILEELNYGTRLVAQDVKLRETFGRNSVVNSLLTQWNNKVKCEEVRCGVLPPSIEDYIEYANRR